jgi:mono/diheme cytochrome c family protein/Tol biopolymer transport system component
MRSWLVIALAALLIAAVALGGYILGRRSAAPPGVAQTTQVDNLSITMQLDNPVVGERTVEVAVKDAAGNPVDAQSVRLRFTMVEMDMGVSELDAQPVGGGRYQARGPFFTMVGDWKVDATVERAGQPAARATFAFPIAAPGEVSGSRNPLSADAATLVAGRQLYADNCATCHGVAGKGDGPSAEGLNPRPADFSQHMIPGKHTDGQVFQWIKDGFPGTAMPAWSGRLSDEQIWQLVTYLRTFGAAAAAALARTPGAVAPTQAAPAQVPEAREPLPPLIFVRGGNIWRSDGTGAAPRQLTNNAADRIAQNPSISPDGKQIALVALNQPRADAALPVPTSALLVMGVDGSNARPIWEPAEGLLAMPAWAPDGKAIYVAANGVKSLGGDTTASRLLQVVRVDVANGAARPLLADALDAAISRDGRQLAYLKLSPDGYTMSLHIAAPDGSGEHALIDDKQFQGFYAPRFSPDGKQIVVAAIGGPPTDDRGNPLAAPSGASPLDGLLGLFAPATAEAHGLPWDLWVVNSGGGGLRRLTQINEDLPMAAYSPDGKQIAVLGAGGFYLMDADGANLRRIDPAGDHGGLDWAPN